MTILVENHKIFQPPCIWCPRWRDSPLGIWYRRWGQKTRMRGYLAEKEVWRYLPPSGYNAPKWQTDGRTDRHRATEKTALTYSVER